MDDVAALLALLAAVCFALAATLWQKAALSLSGVSFRHPTSFLVLLGQWVWLLGLAAQIVGVVLQAAALDRGRVSIIQPLLVTTVIWALPLGYFLTHQTVGRREILGAAIIVVGLAGFASFGDPAAGIEDAPGSVMPSASAIAAIVDAVPIVMQVPNERAMPFSISAQSASLILPARFSSQYFQTSDPEPSVCPRQLPRSMGPAGQ